MSFYELSPYVENLSKSLPSNISFSSTNTVFYSQSKHLLISSCLNDLIFISQDDFQQICIGEEQIVFISKENNEPLLIVVTEGSIKLIQLVPDKPQRIYEKFTLKINKTLTNMKIKKQANLISLCGFYRNNYQLINQTYIITKNGIKLRQQNLFRYQNLGLQPHLFGFNASFEWIFFYTLFNEKKKPTTVWKVVSETEKKKYQIISLYDNFTIQKAQQAGENSLVLGCNSYLFGNKKTNKSFIWVYDLRVGYTRNIIDIQGYIKGMDISNMTVKVQTKRERESLLKIVSLQKFQEFGYQLQRDYICQNREYVIFQGRSELLKVKKSHKKMIYHKMLGEIGLSLEMMNQTLLLL